MVENSNVGSQDMVPDDRPASRASSQESWKLDTGIDLLLEFGQSTQSTDGPPPGNIGEVPTTSSASDINRHLLDPSGVESDARDAPSFQRAPSQESWELDTGIDLLLEFGHMSDRLSQAGGQETSSREKDGAVDLFPAQSTQSTDGQPPGNIGEVPTMSSGSDTHRHLLQPDSSGVESDARDAPSSHRSVPMSQDVEMEDMYHPPRPQSTSVPAALRASLGGQDKPNTGSLSQPPRSSGEDRPVWLKDTLRDHIRWIADRKKTILRELEDLDSQIAVLESLVAAYVIPADAYSEGLKV